MDPNSFSAKVYFSLIDKFLIGILAAGVTFFFQIQQYKYQMLLNANVAISKINTDIIVKQREDLVKEMGSYSLLLEEIKTIGSPNDDQVKSLAAHRHRLNFIIDTLGAVDSKIEEEAQSLLASIKALNLDLTTKPVPPDKIEQAINNILDQYMHVLNIIRDIGISKTVEEFKKATQQTKRAYMGSKMKHSAPVTETSR